MAHSTILYDFQISIPPGDLRRACLRFAPELHGSGGIDTSVGLQRGYPESCRKALHEWLALEEQHRPMSGLVLVQSWRNLIQNHRSIAWTRGLGIRQSAFEQAELSRRPYYGMAFLANGQLRAERFLPSDGLPDDVEL